MTRPPRCYISIDRRPRGELNWNNNCAQFGVVILFRDGGRHSTALGSRGRWWSAVNEYFLVGLIQSLVNGVLVGMKQRSARFRCRLIGDSMSGYVLLHGSFWGLITCMTGYALIFSVSVCET